MHLGEIIYNYRQANNKMSMDEFAERSGLSKSYISMLEKNINPITGSTIAPSIDTIKQVANAMGIEFNQLFEMLDEDQEVTVTENPKESKKMQKFLDLIYEEMSHRHMNFNELSEKSGIHRSRMKKYENRTVQKIPYSELYGLSKALHLDVRGMMGWSDDSEEYKRYRLLERRLNNMGNQNGNYYLDEETAKKAQEIYEDKSTRILLDAKRDLKKEDLDYIVGLVKRLKGEN